MLHGPVVSLRPMERDDIPRLWEFAQDLEIGLTTGYMGRPTPLAAVEEFYEERYGGANPNAVFFGIEAHDLLIGGVEIDHIDWQNRSASIVVFIGDPAYRRRGCGGRRPDARLQLRLQDPGPAPTRLRRPGRQRRRAGGLRARRLPRGGPATRGPLPGWHLSGRADARPRARRVDRRSAHRGAHEDARAGDRVSMPEVEQIPDVE